MAGSTCQTNPIDLYKLLSSMMALMSKKTSEESI